MQKELQTCNIFPVVSARFQEIFSYLQELKGAKIENWWEINAGVSNYYGTKEQFLKCYTKAGLLEWDDVFKKIALIFKCSLNEILFKTSNKELSNQPS